MLMRTPVAAKSRAFGHLHHAGLEDAGNRRPEAQTLMALLRSQKQVTYHARDIIFHEGDRAEAVFLLMSGAIRLYRFMPNGRRLVARFVFPQDVIGLGYDDFYPFTAEAIKPVTVCRMARSQLSALCARSPSLQSEVVLMLKHELTTACEDILPMMHQTAEARIARLLSMLARRNGTDLKDGARIQLTMTRADIADFLGLTIETVCRSFTKLKGEGLISASAQDEIRLENASTLMALAEGEC